MKQWLMGRNSFAHGRRGADYSHSWGTLGRIVLALNKRV